MADTEGSERHRRGPRGVAHVDEIVAVSNVMISVCGGVYNATRSTTLTAVAWGCSSFSGSSCPPCAANATGNLSYFQRSEYP